MRRDGESRMRREGGKVKGKRREGDKRVSEKRDKREEGDIVR